MFQEPVHRGTYAYMHLYMHVSRCINPYMHMCPYICICAPTYAYVPLARAQGHICIYGFMSKICLGKKFLCFQDPTCAAKKPGIAVAVFLPTLQLTALLLKSLRLRLYCYTPPYPLKRALYSIKRALYSIKRVIRVQYSEAPARFSKNHKSTIFYQKRPTSSHKSPIFYEKGHKSSIFYQKSPISSHKCCLLI